MFGIEFFGSRYYAKKSKHYCKATGDKIISTPFGFAILNKTQRDEYRTRGTLNGVKIR